MLKLVQVDSYYGRSHVLHGVNLDVQTGEITTILGRNGTGKTTLLKTIMGLTDRTTGEIRFGNDDIAAEPTFRRARAGFAYVPQGREIIPDFTIRENILLGAFARTDGRRSIPSLVPELFPVSHRKSGSPRRRAVGRTAAAARDCARARRGAEDPAAR